MLRSIVLVSIIGLAACLAACYAPAYEEGIACGPGRSCPSGLTCAADDTCRRGTGGLDDADPGGGGRIDAASVGGGPADASLPDASLPDATPVDCVGDEDCQSPPTLCQLAGTCDVESHTCRFLAVDCTGLDGECTSGVCDAASGACVAQAINQDASCGAGESCGLFGSCIAESGICDETGVQTRTCTVNTCQAGACVTSTQEQQAACALPTDGVTCSPPTQTDCSACNYSSACDELAARTCTCSTYSCADSACVASPVSCMEECTRETEGDFCPPDGICTAQGTCRQNPCPLCIGPGDHPG